jgi:TFIIF-interacting CTD phosphatase-like protein
MKDNFLLDLDQTLISAEALEEFDDKKNKLKKKKFVHHNMDGYYIVFERPYLQEFLDYLFENFNVSIWTAASKEYALFILDKIILQKKGRKIDYLFFSYHCKISSYFKNGTKMLDMLWDIYKITDYKKENTFILDDYDDVYKKQPENAIIAIPFQYYNKESENDNFLKGLIELLKKLKERKINVKDINNVINGKDIKDNTKTKRKTKRKTNNSIEITDD